MRAVVVSDHGDTDVLVPTEVDEPAHGPTDVVVDVVAAGVNRADVLQRRGFYPEPGPAPGPEIPGMELSGRVSAVGERVGEWRPGDEVMGIVSGGAYAERVVLPGRQAIAVPGGVGLADAAAICEVFITAWDALVIQGGLTQGRTALVHAGGSGVGTAAIQVAKALGARVLVTASAGKHEACRRLGADEVIDYRAEGEASDWVAAAKEMTAGRGVDVVLDVVGGDYLSGNLAALATGGTIVQVGVMGGGRTEVDLAKLLPKRATLRGTVLRGRPVEEKIAVSRRFAAEVVPRFAAGELAPVIDSRFALDDVAEAHRRMESNANVGKILLDVAP